MTFAIIKTSAGYMVTNTETGDYVNDENGDNTFDDIKDAERILNAITILSALGDKPKRPSKKEIDVMRDIINLAIENRPDDEYASDFDARLNRLQVIIQEWEDA